VGKDPPFVEFRETTNEKKKEVKSAAEGESQKVGQIKRAGQVRGLMQGRKFIKGEGKKEVHQWATFSPEG